MVASRFLAITCVCFAIVASAAPRQVSAQFGGDEGGPGGEGRGGRGRGFGGPDGGFRGPGGPGGRGFDPAAMAGRFDRDGDGEIAPDEIPEFLRDRFADQIREAGKDPEKPIPVDEFGEIMQAGFERMREQGGGPGGFGGRGGPPGQDGAGRGPGGDDQGRRGRGRGGRGRGREEQQPEPPQRPTAVNDFADSGPPASGRPRPESSGPDDQSKEIAQRLLDRIDENDDGILQEEEWRGYRLNNLEPADASGDKTITLEELTNWTAETRRRVARENGGGEAGGRSRRPAPSAESVGSASGRGSYRESTIRDRLPSGLPPWFMQRDADGDGQVMMHEWTRSWTNAELANFQGNDANGDGVITPAEAIAAGR